MAAAFRPPTIPTDPTFLAQHQLSAFKRVKLKSPSPRCTLIVPQQSHFRYCGKVSNAKAKASRLGKSRGAHFQVENGFPGVQLWFYQPCNWSFVLAFIGAAR